uniref:Uncharacterized protein n=1 Tax=Bactrocera latifrons TaxID=174628 RepID=A0A0K8V0C8_BACLA
MLFPARKISPAQLFCYSTSELLFLFLLWHAVVPLQVWRCSSNCVRRNTLLQKCTYATPTHATHASCRALIRYGRRTCVEAAVSPFALTPLRITTFIFRFATKAIYDCIYPSVCLCVCAPQSV